MLIEVKDKLSRQQDKCEDPLHAFEGMDANIFHIQAWLLIEAIAMFDAST